MKIDTFARLEDGDMIASDRRGTIAIGSEQFASGEETVTAYILAASSPSGESYYRGVLEGPTPVRKSDYTWKKFTI